MARKSSLDTRVCQIFSFSSSNPRIEIPDSDLITCKDGTILTSSFTTYGCLIISTGYISSQGSSFILISSFGAYTGSTLTSGT